MDSVFHSKKTAAEVMDMFDAYANLEKDWLSKSMLQCQDKEFLLDEIGLKKMHANVVYQNLRDADAGVTRGLMPTPVDSSQPNRRSLGSATMEPFPSS